MFENAGSRGWIMNHLQIYRTMASLLEGGENAALITVVSTEGSTPGKVGYKMLLWGEQGRTEGTVGGGLSEHEVATAAAGMLGKACSDLRRFELAGTGEDERGICGGAVEFLIEAFDRDYAAFFRRISQAISKGRSGVVLSAISPPDRPRKFFVEDFERMPEEVRDLGLSQESLEKIASLAQKGEAARNQAREGMAVFAEAVAVEPMLFIFGAGHLAAHIAKSAGLLGFRVTVCDERQEYANRQRFPDADNVVVSRFEEVFDKINIDRNCYVVIVTRGHKCDEVVLEKVLGFNPRYVGMIGSRRKTVTILESLRAKGVPAEKLERVYAPIGISIGAVTPEEIALSIMAELVTVRRLGDDEGVGHMKIDVELQRGKGAG